MRSLTLAVCVGTAVSSVGVAVTFARARSRGVEDGRRVRRCLSCRSEGTRDWTQAFWLSRWFAYYLAQVPCRYDGRAPPGTLESDDRAPRISTWTEIGQPPAAEIHVRRWRQIGSEAEELGQGALPGVSGEWPTAQWGQTGGPP